MVDVTTIDKPRALLSDPGEKDAIFWGRTLHKEVKDSRSIETGDVLFEKTTEFDQSRPIHTSYEIILATFKPQENPARLVMDTIPYPDSRKTYINRLGLIRVSGDGDEPKNERETYSNITEHQYSFDLNDRNNSRPPVRSVYVEDYRTSGSGTEGNKRLTKPIMIATEMTKILNPEEDLPKLKLTLEEMRKLLENARVGREFLAKNLLDQPDETTGLTDPRLHQLDALINYLSVQTKFIIS